jgi:hypothetical protein
MSILVPIDRVRPSAYNPRMADPARLDLIALSIRKLGWLLPVYADAGGEILSGHQRHLVADRMGLTHVPVETVAAMPLHERKAVNIMFNRGTNDMSMSDTPETLTEALQQSSIYALAEALPDLSPDDPASFYPCLTTQRVPIKPVLKANLGRWDQYATNMARALYSKGINMPIILRRDNTVVNGIGRLENSAQKGKPAINVITLDDAQADFAAVMLNLLSMDFDIHRRYEDLLRHNSFRRLRRSRRYLGRGFVSEMTGSKSANTFDITDPVDLARWKAFYGTCVVDFGAGHLHETDLLRAQGIEVHPFEPYRVDGQEDIDKLGSIALAREFLETVASGRLFDSVFIASVLNSVPFQRDREHIATICAALCGPHTGLYAVASSVKATGWRNANGNHLLNATDGKTIAFALDYEPGIRLGDFKEKPKVQKYHTPAEFYDLFSPHFESVQVRYQGNNVVAVCRTPKPVDADRLHAALAFEFDLPYPDGSRMGLVEEAIAAFSCRVGVAL